MQSACAVLYWHLWPLRLHIFSKLSHKRQDFRKKKMLLRTKCVFLFSLHLLSVTFLVLRRNERDVIKNVHWSSCGVSNFNET